MPLITIVKLLLALCVELKIYSYLNKPNRLVNMARDVSIELGNEREGIVLFRPVIGVALLPSGHWGQGGTGPV